MEHRHGPIAELEEVAAIVQDAEGRPAGRSPIHGDQRPAALGVDLEPVTAMEVRTPISARFVGVAADVAAAPSVRRLER